MNKTKKLILIVALLLSLTLVFAACDLQDILDGIGSGGGSGNGGDETILKIQQVIGQSYTTVTEGNVASVVASNNLAAVYEITAILEFDYVIDGTSGAETVSTSAPSTSTAFAINSDGVLLTNAHCITVDETQYPNAKNFVYTNRTIFANLADQDQLVECDILAYNKTMDLAVLKILEQGDIFEYEDDGETIVSVGSYTQLDDTPYVTFFSHTDPKQADQQNAVEIFYGETVVAIGNSKGYGISVTTGVVSAPLREFDWDENSDFVMRVIQTDAAINSGNSGGPLFNAYGAVLGINTFKVADDQTDNMAFAVPTYVVFQWLKTLEDGTFVAAETKSADPQNKNVEIAFSGTLAVQYFFTTTRAFSSTGQYTSTNIQ